MKLVSCLKRFFYFLIFTLILTCGVSFAQEKVVAIVNNDIITQKDLDDFVNFTRVQMSADYRGRDLENKIQSMKLNLLNRLIEDRLILQEAKRSLEEARKNKDMYTTSRLDIDQNKIKGRIEEIKKKFESDTQFQKSLKQQGLVQADLETRIKEQLLMYNIIEIKVKSKIIINPAEITDFYEKNMAEFMTSEQREFGSLTTEDEAIASHIYNELKRGCSFDEMAQQYSLQVNKLTAGKGELMKEVEDIVFGLNINGISKPAKFEKTFSIFKLIKIIPPRKQNLSEAQDAIYNYLYERKMQEGLSNWLDELKKRSYIKILSD
ncbi:MAG: peptidyl-prolyl cis-trans isomerase [Candidatus Omnitrophota bacterium]|nr:peptidyl-prolyl cis-trans isomerase [Candidatus Omnitrophota bacterium]